MKITREQYENAIRAAMEITAAGNAAYPRYQSATSAILHSLGIEVDDSCTCSTTVREYCASNNCHGGADVTGDATAVGEYVWIERTWADVRQHDVIRPAGQATDEHAAEVIEIGPANRWHAAPGASQYWPNESPLEWSARRVTMLPLRRQGDAGAQPFTPEHGMRPDAAVEIRVTRGELAAIEALGGWENRVSTIIEAQEQGIVTS